MAPLLTEPVPGPERSRPHLNLQPVCGACGDNIFDNEMTVALLGSDGIPRGWKRSQHLPVPKAFRFPPHGEAFTPPGSAYSLCRWPAASCNDCATSPECVALHEQCFCLFSRRWPAADALHRLWLFATRRLPWPRCPRLYILPSPPPSNRNALGRVAADAGIPGLAGLPTEIVGLIHAQSTHAPFWRFVAVLDLFERIITAPRQVRVDVQLCDLVRWERGTGDVDLGDGAPDPDAFVRVSIDAWGIFRTERLCERPRYDGYEPRDKLYVVERAAKLDGIMVTIQDGLLRLTERYNLRLWDTPGRVNGSKVRFTHEPSAWPRMRTVPLDGLAGITFFFGSNTLLDMYPHRFGDSSARAAWDRFTANQKHDALWQYVPLSPGSGDRVTAVGVRFNKNVGGYNMLIRTHLCGDVILGMIWDASAHGKPQPPLSHGTSTTILFNDPDEGASIQAFGVLCEKPATVDPHPLAVAFSHPDLWVPGPGMHYSSAPLDGIVAAEVFESTADDAETGGRGNGGGHDNRCRGVLLYYANKTVRALGECRVNVVQPVRVENPTALCFRYTASRGVGSIKGAAADAEWRGLCIEFSHGYCAERHGHHAGSNEERQKWQWVALRGVIEFWFSRLDAYVEVSDGMAE